MDRRIHIDAISPAIDCGAHPVKRAVGDELSIAADILRDGHAALRAQVRWRDGRIPTSPWEVV